MEKSGLLSEPGVLLELRRPADVLIEGALRSSTGASDLKPFERSALDIKVVNALGRRYIDGTRCDPLSATVQYHDEAMLHNQTAAKCAAQGVSYVPMVFTAQGGMGKKAEAILHQLASRNAPLESKTASVVFG